MAITETSAAQLIINQLTREQYNNLGNDIEDNQLYIIDENILGSANEYFANSAELPDDYDIISAFSNDSDVVNKAYVTQVVDNINDSLTALTTKHDREISAKQDKLTDTNEGAYINITANDNSSFTTIAVTNVVSAGTAISAEATQSSLTTSKAVKEYVEAKTASGSHKHDIADVNDLQDALDAKQDNLTDENASSYIAITEATDTAPATIAVTNVVSAGTAISAEATQSSLTTSKAVKEYVEVHTGNADIHVTATQKADWTSTSATVAANSAKWNEAIQDGSTENSAYIKLDRITGNILHVTPVFYTGTLSNLSDAVNPTGIVQPALIKELNTKVNEFHQIPQFSVVVAKSINVGNATYVPSNSTEAVACVQNTVYLVPDNTEVSSIAGTHIEYLCYKAGENLVIEQIGTTNIDLSEYAKTADITEELEKKQDKLTTDSDSHITITTDNKISVSDVTNDGNDIKIDDTGLTTGKAVYEYVDATAAPVSHTHTIANVTDLQDALNAKQDNLTNENAGDYIAITEATDTAPAKISVTNIITDGTNVTEDNDDLTTGKAVREALNNMIVFRKHT